MDVINQRSEPSQPRSVSREAAPGPAIAGTVLSAVRRHWRLVVCLGLLTTVVAAGVGLGLPQSYTSSAQLLIDPRGLKVVEKDIAPQAREPDLSVSIIESEMRFLTSDRVLHRVIEALDLTDGNLAFAPAKGKAGTGDGLARRIGAALDRVRGAVRSLLARPELTQSPEQKTMTALQRAIKVSRQPNTYVLDISATTRDRDMSAGIVNAMAQAYTKARLEARADASEKATQSIEGRLAELRTQVRNADDAVETYKKSNGLVSAAGHLLTEQRMSELTTQLQAAQTETIKAEARRDQARQLKASGSLAEGSVEALQSPALERLRATQALVRQREAALSATLLPAHPLVRQVRQERQAAQRGITLELERIASAADTALSRARATEHALSDELGRIKSEASREGAANVQLHELERVAEAERTVYQSFLVRTRELVEQQRIDPNLAVTLSAAEPATAPNGPGLLPVVGAGGLLGLGLGAALALRRERSDPRVMSAAPLEALLGPERVHSVGLPRDLRSAATRISNDESTLLYYQAMPGSPMELAMARLYRSATLGRRPAGPHLLLALASEPFQGKSTIALNLAVVAARAGDRVLLIDADSTTRVATLAEGAGTKPGLGQVLAGAVSCDAAIIRSGPQAFDLLPAGDLGHTGAVTADAAAIAERLLAALGGYDTVVIDGPAEIGSRLAMALANRADTCLLVTQAGKADRGLVDEATGWLERTATGQIRAVLVEAA